LVNKFVTQVQASEHRSIGTKVKIGTNTKINGRNITIGSNSRIGNDVSISADEIQIGNKSTIEDRVQVSWKGGTSRVFSVGDCNIIGSDSKILAAEFIAGDYVTLHNHLLVTGDERCSIGHNTWVGQNSILNSNASLKIGNGVGIGAYSSVWTHGKYGELLEGCQIYKEGPVMIEDGVWIVGAYNVISPGVRIGEKSIILTGSVITKDVKPNSCYGGSPAIDLSDKIKTYREVTIEEKFEMMKRFVFEFLEKFYHEKYEKKDETQYHVNSDQDCFKFLLKWELTNDDLLDNTIVLAITVKNSTQSDIKNVTIFDLSTKKYTKRLTDQEVKFMRFLLDARARFCPC
jgi:acetyltransferase-like isoleucine patch superfamily enzyme